MGRAWSVLLLSAGLVACRANPSSYAPLPPEAEALLVQAEAALQQQAFIEALQLANRAESQAPAHPDVLFFKGRLYTRMMLLDAADSLYHLVAQRVPDYPGLWHNLANNAARRGQFGQAVAYYRKELKQKPTPLAWRGLARAYQELGRVDSAHVAYEMALRLDSTYAEAWLDLAELYEKEGRLQEALLAARRAWEQVPHSLIARYRLGNLLRQTGQLEAARVLLESVVQEAPWHHAAHYSLGLLLQQQGAREAAQHLIKKAETLRALQAKVEQAELMISNTPRDPYAYATLGSLLRRLGQYAEALYAYQVARYLDPKNLEFQNNIAILYLLLGQADQALAWLEQAVQQDSTFVDGWINLGILYARRGNVAAAREAWERARRLAPNRPEPQRYLTQLAAGTAPNGP
ncbi:TPR repeat-containing protein YrrB [bacterium HR18]|nr:TPR repeat-containing protein YrrB [bacterium HR18]